MPLIIRHFDNPLTAQQAVAALTEAGIAEEKIGFLTKEGVRGHFDVPAELDPDDVSTAEGTLLGSLAGMAMAVAALATPLGPLIGAGPLFGALIGVLAGGATGGIVASLVDFGVDERLARRLAATLDDERAVLLSVEVPAQREAEARALLAQTERLHEDELRFFEGYHERHLDVPYEQVHGAYHFGYRSAARAARPFADAEAELRAHYPGEYDVDREAIEVGYQRYLDTVQVVDAPPA